MPTNIHPTAIIEPGAQIDEDVTIDPFTMIGANVTIGSGSRIHHHATVDLNTTLGKDCEVYPYAYLGGLSQDLKFSGGNPGLTIGDRNVFREFTSVHVASHEGESTTLGNDNLLLAYSHIAHDCQVGNHLIMSSHSALGGHVILANNINVGWDAGVHQFCHIGSGVMIGACSKVVKDIPPYMIVDGNPSEVRTINKVGLKRMGFSDDDLGLARLAYKIIFREGLNRSQALAKLIKHENADNAIIQELIAFIKDSERGLA